jgi:hypothetical protein
MIIAEIVEAEITRRSTNIDRPSGPLWTSNCKSLEGNTITDSVNPRSLLFRIRCVKKMGVITPKYLRCLPISEWDQAYEKAKYQGPTTRLRRVSVERPMGIPEV